jgi:hypothetical protein
MKDTSPKYHVYLRQQDFGERKKAVFEVLKQSVPKLNLTYQTFGANLRGSDCIHSWPYQTDMQVKTLEKKFSAFEIQLDVKEANATFLFPSDTVAGNANNVYSEVLLQLGEDALDDYANLIGIEEIYRFTLIATFTPAITVRVSEYEIIKKQTDAREKPTATDNWNPTENQWLSILRALDKHLFWSSASWNTPPDNVIYRDGEILLFEGYKDGQYKFLSDEVPESGSAYELQHFFLNLKPDSK